MRLPFSGGGGAVVEQLGRKIAARRQLYGYYRIRIPTVRRFAIPTTPICGRRRITPVILAGRLHATKEERLPYEIDPNTLDTLGPIDFGGLWRSRTCTAHSKYDLYTGDTIAYGYEVKGLASNDVHVAAFDAAGRIGRSLDFKAP